MAGKSRSRHLIPPSPSLPLCVHRIMTDVLRAVAQCHAKGVLLRDVKPENFL